MSQDESYFKSMKRAQIKFRNGKLLLLLLLLLLFTEMAFSLGGSSPYTSNKIRINKHHRNNKKTQ